MINSKILAEGVLNDPSFVAGLYDYIRIVDPMHKTVESYHTGSHTLEIGRGEHGCFGLWNQGQACENCISMRAFNSGDTFVKIGCRGDKVFMATAVPVNKADSRHVVELLKDITHTGILDIEGKETDHIHKIIAKRNQTLVKDALTGAYNRGFIFERLPYDITRANKEGQPLTLVFVSINGFHTINDKYGVMAGDVVAREFVKTLKYYCGNSSDWCARYSEAEFIVVLDSTIEKQAYQICKRVAKKISQMTVSFEKRVIPVSADIGFYTMKSEPLTSQNLIDKARKGLYTTNEIRSEDKSEAREIVIRRLSLTVSERETALLLLKGLTNIEIAEQLFVSVSTVKKHISSILTKAEVRSRAEFIAKYTQP
ncbi:MAG: diguanylate cyclase [Chitinophagales bacterium]